MDYIYFTISSAFIIIFIYIGVHNRIISYLFRNIIIWIEPPEEETQKIISSDTKKSRKKAKPDDAYIVPKPFFLSIEYLSQLNFYNEFTNSLFYFLVALCYYFFSEIFSCFSLCHSDMKIDSILLLFSIFLVFYELLKYTFSAGYYNLTTISTIFLMVIFGVISFLLHYFAFDISIESEQTAIWMNTILKEQSFEFIINSDSISLISRIILSLLIGLFSGILHFSSRRISLSYLAISTNQSVNVTRTITIMNHINFFLPIFISLSYIDPLTRNIIVNDTFSNLVYDKIQYILLIVSIIIRFYLFLPYIQAYSVSGIKIISQISSTQNISRSEKNVNLIRSVIRSYRLTIGVAALNLIYPCILFTSLILINQRKTAINFGICQYIAFENPFLNQEKVELFSSLLKFSIFYLHLAYSLQIILSYIFDRMNIQEQKYKYD